MMRMILNGYGGYATIDKYAMLMTSFSLSMNEKMIESEGIADYLFPRLSANEPRRFRKYRFGALRDYPEYQISLSCEMTLDLYCRTLELIESNFDTKIPVYFVNNSTGISYSFTDCYLMSFNLEVGQNSVATGTYTFMSFQDTIDINFNNGNYTAGFQAPNSFIGTSLMPYWAFGVWYWNDLNPDSVARFQGDNVLDLSLSYERSITPKYGCFGVSNDIAPGPYRVVIGIPTINMDFTLVVGNQTNLHPYLIPSKKAAFSDYVLQVHYKKVKSESTSGDGEDSVNMGFRLTRCYLTSYALSAGDGGTVDKFRVSGSCYGRLITVKE